MPTSDFTLAMKNITKKFGLLAVSLCLLSGCEKDYLETLPSDKVSGETVFQTTDGGYVALNGIYRSMWTTIGTGSDAFGQKAIDIAMDVMGNDVVINGTTYGWYNNDQRYVAPVSGPRSATTWQFYYRTINNANNIISRIDGAAGAMAHKENIKGQALALRAYSYFYLVNLWQHTYKGHENDPGVPLYAAPTQTGKPRASVQAVYDQIIADLAEAEKLLAGKTRQHISHINGSAVKGIRARVALQMEDWPTAATKANEARQGFALMDAAAYGAGFSKYNSEWIWGLEIPADQTTNLASFFSHYDATTLSYAQAGMQKKITRDLYEQIPEGDNRKALFRTPGTATATQPEYNANKFRVPVASSWAADYVLMRSGEMYLIEAEALARQNITAAAVTLLETVVNRSNPAYQAPARQGGALINEILLQRRIELWGEGFSLLDMKRLKQGLNRPSGPGNHQPAIAVVYTLPAEDKAFLYRIPQAEIDANESINPEDQNP
jgi:hypothetical protein